MESEDLFVDDDPEGTKGYFDYNRDSLSAIYVDEKENAIDSLETAAQFLDRDDNLKWKWFVIAIHHSLYSFNICALENGNYQNVTFTSYSEDENFIIQTNNAKAKKSTIEPFLIKNKYKTSAYRILWQEIDVVPEFREKEEKKEKREKLIGFWTALARVQDPIFWMGRLTGTKPVVVSDEELEKICWLSDQVRNDLVHFIPKGYSIGVLSIIEAGLIMLKTIKFLANESNSIVFLNHEQSLGRINKSINLIENNLKEIQKNISESHNKIE